MLFLKSNLLPSINEPNAARKATTELNTLLSQYFDELIPERKTERKVSVESGENLFKKLKQIKFIKLPKSKRNK